MLSVLRQPRYLALSALMAVVALVCVGLGTWQVSRYDWKHTANDDLRRNTQAPVTTVASQLPLVPAQPNTDAVENRRVTATGSYDAAHQVLVRKVQLNGSNGFYVLTPFVDTDGRALLVVRGFVATSTTPQSPPTGIVTITGRVRPADTADDKASQLTGAGQVESINAAQQGARLSRPTYDGYVELLAGQPGTSGVTALPEPDLSNPAGGAIEPQHIAYILQWYVFAIMAIAGPLVLARAESRREPDPARPHTVEDKLTDRYGRTHKAVSRREAL